MQWFNIELVSSVQDHLVHLILAHLVDLVHSTDRNSPGSPDPGSPGYEAAPRVLAPPSCCLFVTGLFVFSDRHRLNNHHRLKIRSIFKISIIFKITMIVTFFVSFVTTKSNLPPLIDHSKSDYSKSRREIIESNLVFFCLRLPRALRSLQVSKAFLRIPACHFLQEPPRTKHQT